MLAAVAGDDDVSCLCPDTGVAPRNEVRIAVVTGESGECPRKCEPVPLCDPARTSHVRLRPLGFAFAGGVASEFVEPLDALLRE